ncbi:hypothetical protein N7470_002504 [Penicillium chermesinum]|nr:hypothetical protein N7470_002504 [Penicillium chermesinum]
MKAAHARLYPRHHNPTGFLPIAPRPSGQKDPHTRKKDPNSSSPRPSRSGSTSAASVSSAHDPSQDHARSIGAGYWSGSDGSGIDVESSTAVSRAHSTAGLPVESGFPITAGSSRPLASSAPDATVLDPALGNGLFDPMYSLLTSSVSEAGLTQTCPLTSPVDGGNPFDFPLDPLLGLDASHFGYREDMDVDVTEGLTDEMFHVEDWSRYMWSPETGLEHLDMGFPPAGAR